MSQLLRLSTIIYRIFTKQRAGHRFFKDIQNIFHFNLDLYSYFIFNSICFEFNSTLWSIDNRISGFATWLLRYILDARASSLKVVTGDCCYRFGYWVLSFWSNTSRVTSELFWFPTEKRLLKQWTIYCHRISKLSLLKKILISFI